MKRSIVRPLRLGEVIAMERAKQRLRVWVWVLLGTVLTVLPQPSKGQVTPPAPVSSQAVADTGTIVAEEFRLRYRIEGTGRPAIVIGSAVYYPRVFSQNLRKHLRLVFLDHRGFAPSPGHVDTTAFALDSLVEISASLPSRFGKRTSALSIIRLSFRSRITAARKRALTSC